MSILQPRSLLKGLLPVTMYTDATPHSVAAIIPTLKMSFAQAFQVPEEINRAEAFILGLQWASVEFTDCHFHIYCDNSSVVATLTKGTGSLRRHHDLRRLHLSTLHGLRGNTFEILQFSSAQNLADRPSRAVLHPSTERLAQPTSIQMKNRTLSVLRGWH